MRDSKQSDEDQGLTQESTCCGNDDADPRGPGGDRRVSTAMDMDAPTHVHVCHGLSHPLAHLLPIPPFPILTGSVVCI